MIFTNILHPWFDLRKTQKISKNLNWAFLEPDSDDSPTSHLMSQVCHCIAIRRTTVVYGFILVLRSGPVESNLRVESKSCALHDVELRLRILGIQLDMLTAGRPHQGGDTGGDQTQQQRADHDWREERGECRDHMFTSPLHLSILSWGLRPSSQQQAKIAQPASLFQRVTANISSDK